MFGTIVGAVGLTIREKPDDYSTPCKPENDGAEQQRPYCKSFASLDAGPKDQRSTTSEARQWLFCQPA